MNEKLSLQNIADALALKAGVSKKAADAFSKAFFDTIVEVLATGEETVKVKGMGTFKLVSVENRESVNVTNGERIIIPGYKKVAFTPEESVVEFLNRKEEVHAESEVYTENTENTGIIETETDNLSATSVISVRDKKSEKEAKDDSVSEEETIDALIQVPEPAHVEQPQDKFAGIDMLISTPESVEEVRQQYEEAKVKMEAAVAEARKANAEKMRLEKLLQRLDENVVPESVGQQPAEEDASEVQNVPVEVVTQVHEDENQKNVEEKAVLERPIPQEQTDEEKRKEAFNRVMSERPKVEAPQEKQNGKKWWVIAVVALLLAAILFFLYRTFLNIEAVEEVPKVERKVKPNRPAKPTKPASAILQDSLKKAQQADSIKKAQEADSIRKAFVADSLKRAEEAEQERIAKEEKAKKPARPATHVMQRGESLTRISQKYYGTKDSVRAIIRANTFKDPNNVPIGATVKLP